MGNPVMVLHNEEYQEFSALCLKLLHDAQAKTVLLIDKSGQHITSCGDTHGLDTTSLSSLAAGNVAATMGLAQLMGEKEFPSMFHEGEREHLYVAVVAQAAILMVIFDRRTQLGLVRLKVKKAIEALARVFQHMHKKATERGGSALPFAEITDADMDNLFGV
jgi:predicted regulator of Ras-like GTPase activity (Roadblock/LC7/MglB family)